MGRTANRIERDDLEINPHARNAMCSKALLDALRENHPEQEPVPTSVPIFIQEVMIGDAKPEIQPIPDKAIAAAAEIAFPTFPSRIKQIQLATLTLFPKMTRAELTSSRRKATVVKARQIAMYISKQLTNQSLPEIGRRFGGRDHTTVLHAVRKVERLVETDSVLAAQIEHIKSLIPEVAT